MTGSVAVGHAHELGAVHAVALGVLGAFGAQLPHHVGVAAEVTRGQDDALGRLELHVVTVGVLGDDALNSAVGILHAARRGLPAEPFGAQILGRVAAVFLDFGQARDARLLLLAHGLLVLRAHRLHRGRPHLVARNLHGVIGTAGLVVGDLHDALAALVVEHVRRVGDQRGQVVHHLAGVVHERADDFGVAAAVGAAHVLVDDLVEVVRAEAPRLQHLGVVRADVVAAVNDLAVVVLLDDGDLRALLRRRKRRLRAGMAAAHHHDVEALRLFDVGVGDLGRASQPILVAHVIGRTRDRRVGGRHVAALGRRGRRLRRASGQPGHRAEDAGAGGTHQEVPARKFHVPHLLCVVLRTLRPHLCPNRRTLPSEKTLICVSADGECFSTVLRRRLNADCLRR